jgi:predicted AlkP superfamily phosphohydrolase/phosphomutase
MLVVLHLDSVSLRLLESMLAEGSLPAIARLRERGSWQRLETPGLHLAAAAYPTLYTGVEPGEHGFYYPFQWSADEQRVRLGSGVEMPETIWERIARAGRRSIVIDPYEAPRPRVPVGSFLSGWSFVNRIVLNTHSEPRQLGVRLARREGRAPHLDEVFGRPSARALIRSRDCLIAAPARGAAAALALLAEARCDLAWIAFPAAHIAGHQLWSLGQLPAGDKARATAAGLETGLAAVYAAIDAAVGRIVESLPADADLMLLSPVGMDANESRVELLDGMVEAVLSGGAGAAGETTQSALWRLRARVPTGLRATAARLLPDRVSVALAARLATGRRDWGRTRAFALPADHHGYVRVNLRGREREGVVGPADLDGLLDELAEGLRSFEDVGGGPAVSSVERTQDLYSGPRAHLLPDLVVTWGIRPAPDLAGVRSPRFGLVPRNGFGSGRSGNHTADAWALLVPSSSRIVEPKRQPRLSDIAPTVCAVLGVDPEGLPGEPLLRAG